MYRRSPTIPAPPAARCGAARLRRHPRLAAVDAVFRRPQPDGERPDLQHRHRRAKGLRLRAVAATKAIGDIDKQIAAPTNRRPDQTPHCRRQDADKQLAIDKERRPTKQKADSPSKQSRQGLPAALDGSPTRSRRRGCGEALGRPRPGWPASTSERRPQFQRMDLTLEDITHADQLAKFVRSTRPRAAGLERR